MTKSMENMKVVIVGLGLIGGSIARGLAEKKLCRELVGVGRNTQVLEEAKQAGVIDNYDTDVVNACSTADIVILGVPGLTVEPVLEQLANNVGEDLIITDVASVKESTISAAVKAFGHVPVNFVPGHPIAGSEKSGFHASRVDLYQGRKVILTPLEHTSKESVSIVKNLWEILGAEVLSMSVSRHDQVLAATSHLPHLLAYALVDTLSQHGESQEIFRYAAGGFRDFTRIASSDPIMWRDIFLANGKATVEVLDKYTDELQRLRQALLDGDEAALLQTFERAKKSRDTFNDRSFRKSLE